MHGAHIWSLRADTDLQLWKTEMDVEKIGTTALARLLLVTCWVMGINMRWDFGAYMGSLYAGVLESMACGLSWAFLLY